MTARRDLLAEVRTYIGTPYVHQHRTKGVAIDCAGLVIEPAKWGGYLPADFDVQGYKVESGLIVEHCDRIFDRVERAAMQPADVIVLRTGEGRMHMGWVGDYLYGGFSIIHAANSHRKVVEQQLTPAMLRRFVQAYAMRGI